MARVVWHVEYHVEKRASLRNRPIQANSLCRRTNTGGRNLNVSDGCVKVGSRLLCTVKTLNDWICPQARIGDESWHIQRISNQERIDKQIHGMRNFVRATRNIHICRSGSKAIALSRAGYKNNEQQYSQNIEITYMKWHC